MSTLRLRLHHGNDHRIPVKLPSLEKLIMVLASFVVGSMTTLVVMQGGTPAPPAVKLRPPIERTVTKRRLNNEVDRCDCSSIKAKSNSKNQDYFFPPTVRSYAIAMARTTKRNFVQEIDMGVPVDATINKGEQEVLFMYSHPSALPDEMQANSNKTIRNTKNQMDTSIPPLLDTKSAVANCDFLNVIITRNPDHRRQCTAMVPHYESYHIQKWMRVFRDSKRGGVRDAVDPKQSLTLVSRSYEADGRQHFVPPTLKHHTQPHWKFLQIYLNAMDSILDKLRPICKGIASSKQTIIVMVCNYGQSDLLMNFVCSAKQRSLNIANIIVFATDEKTQALAQSMGLATFYDERIFGSMPSEEAGQYGDLKFTAMMMAKVMSVHLISVLGYNILFQDVDMIWFKDPLTYFESPQQPSSSSTSYFDMYFQDDGGHTLRYAPFSANSGFYYIRSNERTQYFMNAFIMAGDLVTMTKSHQQAMIALLSEHSSLFGLRVKVLSRDETDFPGGYQYHLKSKRFMLDYFAGKVQPYIFHMSWTFNKENKILFLRQMGEWYLHDMCINKTMEDIFVAAGVAASTVPNSTNIGSSPKKSMSLIQPCCSPKPLLSCHYRDKPSKIPCKDSPLLDKGMSSFW